MYNFGQSSTQRLFVIFNIKFQYSICHKKNFKRVGKAKILHNIEGGLDEMLIIAYIVGGLVQKSPQKCLRNIWTVPNRRILWFFFSYAFYRFGLLWAYSTNTVYSWSGLLYWLPVGYILFPTLLVFITGISNQGDWLLGKIIWFSR